MRNRRCYIRIATMLASLMFCIMTAFVSCDWMFSPDEIQPQAVKIVCDSIQVLIGTSPKLSVVFEPRDTTNTSVVWKSNAPDILGVDISTGVLRPYKTGKATITVTSVVDNTISASALFVVSDLVDSSFAYMDINEDERTVCINGFDRSVSRQSLKKIEIPSVVSLTPDSSGKPDVYQVVSILDGAFREMSSLETVVLPNTVRTIGASAFLDCENLRNVTLPDGLETIGDKCFKGCSNLYSIIIPKSVTQIGADAFSDCFRLVEVYDLSDALTLERGSDANGMVAKYALAVHTDSSEESSLKMDDASGIVYFVKPDDEDDEMAVGPLSVQADKLETISGKCKTINDYAFYGMPNLNSVNFASRDNGPKVVAVIGKRAFAECKKLDTVSFSNEAFSGKLEVIGEEAFKGCTSLGKFKVTSAIKEIRNRAFEECTGLKDFEVKDPSGTDRTTLGAIDYGMNIFFDCVSLQNMSLPTLGDKTIGQIFSNEPFGGTKQSYEVAQGANGEKYYVSSTLIGVALTNADSVPDRAFFGCTTISGKADPKNPLLNEGVKRIGDKAFSGVKMTPIDIPSSVVEFGEDVFPSGAIVNYDVTCSDENYDYFRFQNGSLRIYRMSGLKWYEKGLNQLVSEVAFEPQAGETITAIPDNCFKGCFRLASANIPESVKSIGCNAFDGCSALTSVTLPSTLETIGDEAFAFCSSLTFVSVPLTVTSIGNAAFGGCTRLSTISLPFTGKSTAADVQDAQRCLGYIFGNDEKFDVKNSSNQALCTLTNQAIGTEDGKRFYIPNTLESVTITADAAADGTFANLMFSGCSLIKRLSLTVRNLKKLPADAFKGCSNLDTFDAVFKDSTTNVACLEEIGDSAFEGCVKLPSYEFASTLKSIGNSAFKDCSAFTSLGFPNSLTSIGDFAFSGCSKAASVTFTNDALVESGLETIGDEAFAFCSSLTSIAIPQAVTSIGSGAFGGCVGLTEIALPFTGKSKDASMTEAQRCFGYIFGSDEKFNVKGYNAQPLSTFVDQATEDETNKMFYVPKSLKKVSVKAQSSSDGSFSNMMFTGCTDLTELKLDIANLTTVQESAFAGCSSLNKVEIIAKDNSDPDLLDTLKIISDKAFSGCVQMQIVKVSNTIKSIGASAFEGCKKLYDASFLISSPIKALGEKAFCGCKDLRTVDLWVGWRDPAQSEYVTYLPEKVFYDCFMLDIVLPPDVDSVSPTIESNAFGISPDVQVSSVKTRILLPNGYTGTSYTVAEKPEWFSSYSTYLKLYDYHPSFYIVTSPGVGKVAGDGFPNNYNWGYQSINNNKIIYSENAQ